MMLKFEHLASVWILWAGFFRTRFFLLLRPSAPFLRFLGCGGSSTRRPPRPMWEFVVRPVLMNFPFPLTAVYRFSSIGSLPCAGRAIYLRPRALFLKTIVVGRDGSYP